VHILSGLNIKSENGQVGLDVSNRIDFHDSESLERNIAKLTDQVVGGGRIDGTAGAGGIAFGSDQSPENIIDSFSKASINLNLNEYAPTVKKLATEVYDYVMASNNTIPSYNIQSATIDVQDQKTLVSNIVVSLANLTGDFYINIPYLQTGVLWYK
jgi:hypothetical protein